MSCRIKNAANLLFWPKPLGVYPFLAIPLLIIFVIIVSLTIYDDIDSINKSLDTLGALSDDSYRDSLRFRAKKGHTGNEILESEQSS